jgi:hypothetical protein
MVANARSTTCALFELCSMPISCVRLAQRSLYYKCVFTPANRAMQLRAWDTTASTMAARQSHTAGHMAGCQRPDSLDLASSLSSLWNGRVAEASPSARVAWLSPRPLPSPIARLHPPAVASVGCRGMLFSLTSCSNDDLASLLFSSLSPARYDSPFLLNCDTWVHKSFVPNIDATGTYVMQRKSSCTWYPIRSNNVQALQGVSAVAASRHAIHDIGHHIAAIIPKVSVAVALPRRLCLCGVGLSVSKWRRAFLLRL